MWGISVLAGNLSVVCWHYLTFKPKLMAKMLHVGPEHNHYTFKACVERRGCRAGVARDRGLELLCLIEGQFGGRCSDESSLRLGRVARQNSESTTCHLRWVSVWGLGARWGSMVYKILLRKLAIQRIPITGGHSAFLQTNFRRRVG